MWIFGVKTFTPKFSTVLLFESCLSICESSFNDMKFVGWDGSDSFLFYFPGHFL